MVCGVKCGSKSIYNTNKKGGMELKKTILLHVQKIVTVLDAIVNMIVGPIWPLNP